MKLADLRIGTRLAIGLGLMVALTTGLTLIAWRGADALWRQTERLHDKPMAVQEAIADLQSDVTVTEVLAKDQLLSTSGTDSNETLARIEANQLRAQRSLAVLEERYLGPKEDVIRVQASVLAWFGSQREFMRLVRDGRRAEALALDQGRAGSSLALVSVLGGIDRMEGAARDRADRFFAEALAERMSLERRLLGVAGAIIFLSLLLSWGLTRNVRRSLSSLTDAADAFRQGNLDVRVPDTSASEVGRLGAAFNSMAADIQIDDEVRAEVAGLTAGMVRQAEPREFFRNLLQGLLVATGSQVAAVYLRSERGDEFQLFESIGLSAEARRSFSVEGLEGELGPVLATREMRRVRDLPAASRFAFAAVTGQIQPAEIVTLPVVVDGEVLAVVSLAAVRPYTEGPIRVLRDVSVNVAARLISVLADQKTRELARKLEEQNRELDVQGRELVAQADELTEQNVELEAQKRQLDEANRLKSVFLSNMSHELRTPLNSVIALSGVLERRIGSSIGADERSYLEVIQRNGRHLLALINDILDLSRIEAGKEELRVGPVRLRELASDVVGTLGVQAQEKGIALVNGVDGTLPAVASDSDKCRHILQNLVANAVKFTSHGKVEISAVVEGNRARMVVSDTGIGIPADKLEVVFEEFRQAEETTSRRFGGTGLGLSIARRYARLLGGDLTVESTLGEGSTFTLTLPLAIEAARAAPPLGAVVPFRRNGAVSRRPAPAGKGQRILVVEDSEPAIIQMTDVLQSAGYRVEAARDGKQALARIAEELPDAIILDLMMPEVDGMQVVGELRRSPRTRDLPIVILTAKHVTREELQVLDAAHVHQLIQKGDVDREELLAAVAGMVAPRSASPPPEVARREKPRKPERRPVSNPARPRVLVVEDNVDNMATARALLQDRYEIDEAQDGVEALAAARAFPPDLILMDIAMPVMDGIHALAELRKDHALRAIPVYALTASAMNGDRESILAHGFDGYVSKPIDHEVLLAAVGEALRP